jgi:hypothetical protein
MNLGVERSGHSPFPSTSEVDGQPPREAGGRRRSHGHSEALSSSDSRITLMTPPGAQAAAEGLTDEALIGQNIDCGAMAVGFPFVCRFVKVAMPAGATRGR